MLVTWGAVRWACELRVEAEGDATPQASRRRGVVDSINSRRRLGNVDNGSKGECRGACDR